MITTGTQQVWFLTGSQHLYGAEVLQQECLRVLAARAVTIPTAG